MKEYKLTFRGRDIVDCTKEELIECINDITKNDHIYREVIIDSRVNELEKELSIKNEFIDKLISQKRS
jgi:hypothetical protein